MTTRTRHRAPRAAVLLTALALSVSGCRGLQDAVDDVQEGEIPELGGDAPGEDAPAEDTPAEGAPGGDAPGGDAPGGDAPGEDAPGGDAPGEDAPGEDASGDGDITLPPTGVGFDYQLGGDYTPPAGVGIVGRNWLSGTPLGDGYSICYVNAFQTEAEAGTPDSPSGWPDAVVSRYEDPNWPGEYLIDVSTESNRALAAEHVVMMLDTCADKGFDAVEFDNFDSWTRAGATWDKDANFAYATLITDYAHRVGLAVAQKNAAGELTAAQRDGIGFDFAITEDCGQYRECDTYTALYGDLVFDIEYTQRGLSTACSTIGNGQVIQRDLDLRTAGSGGYVFRTC